MYSIFLNYLNPLKGKFDVQEFEKPSDTYTQLRNIYNQGVTGIINSTRIISVGNDDDDYDVINESFGNNTFKQWINWVNKRIVLFIGIEDYRTIDVRLRIATNMLNNMVRDKEISRDLAIKIHSNLITNVKREMSAINTEDLPF